MKILLPASLALTLLCLSSPNGSAAEKKQTLHPAESGSADQQTFRPQMFAGSRLNQARAEEIASAGGFELAAFFQCAFETAECAMFQVIAPDDEVYLYQVSSEPCMKIDSLDREDTMSVDKNVIDGGLRNPVKPSTDKQRRGTKSARRLPTSTGPDIDSVKPQAGSIKVGSQSACFAGYTATYRVREQHQLYSTNLGFSTTLEHHWQILHRREWQDAAVTVASAWSLFKGQGTGLNNQGWAYELRDASGVILTSASYSFDWIASGSGEVKLEERCRSRANFNTTLADAVVEGLYVACKVATVLAPDVIIVEPSFEPLGIGANVKLEKNLAFCENIKESEGKSIVAAGAAIYDDCITNPGKYFPSLYPTDDIDQTLLIIPGYKPAYGILVANAGSVANCPSSVLNHEAADMGDGITCDANVRYQCKLDTFTNACECKNPKVEGAIICTDTNPGPDR